MKKVSYAGTKRNEPNAGGSPGGLITDHLRQNAVKQRRKGGKEQGGGMGGYTF